MRYSISISIILALVMNMAWAHAGSESSKTRAQSREYTEINLHELLPDSLLGAETDIDLWVETSIIDRPELCEKNLIAFIHEIWYPNGGDIREIWNYFASGSTCSLYGEWEDPPGTPAPYNFKYPYPRELTNVRIQLNAGKGSHTSLGRSNQVYLDLEYPDPPPEPYWEIPDDWATGNRVPAAFCHEFQHTIRSHFDFDEYQRGYFEEMFAEAAIHVAGRQRWNVGDDRSDPTWFNYDLVYNSANVFRNARSQYHESQTCFTSREVNKYWVAHLWCSYLCDQLRGDDPIDIKDDFLYKVLRAEENGEPLHGYWAFLKAAESHSAWGVSGATLFRQIFNNWTLANLLDGTGFDPKYEYPNYNVRIRAPNQPGVGWLRDNASRFCNKMNQIPDMYCGKRGKADVDSLCGAWTPDTTTISSVGQTYTFSRDEPGLQRNPIGVEIYAADYSRYVSSTPAGDYILSLSLDVSDEDRWGTSDNILMQANVVSYTGGEDNPDSVWHIDMSQSTFPGYAERLYHHIHGFGTDVDLVDVVVNAMESEVLWGRPDPEGGYVDCDYPMRSYTIRATVVPTDVGEVRGQIMKDATWHHGQTINVTGNLYVNPGVTLTIEPGVTIKVPRTRKIRFHVLGTLKAIGNAVYPIEFVSPSPPEQWIYAMGDGLVTLEHCEVRHADKDARTHISD